MGFYEELSCYYDEIFAANPAELKLVGSMIADKERLLDMGCGTGNKTILLAEGKKETVAFDLDASMIERAEREHHQANIRYLILNMLDIDREFGRSSFDAALCLGNSLAHLLGPREVDSLFLKTAHVLAPGGMVVAQILNYDRILDQGVAELPIIETAHVVFCRKYAQRNDGLHFMTELTVKADGKVLKNDILHRAIRKRELEKAVSAAGFSDMELYGNYAGDPYREDSFHCIIKGML